LRHCKTDMQAKGFSRGTLGVMARHLETPLPPRPDMAVEENPNAAEGEAADGAGTSEIDEPRAT